MRLELAPKTIAPRDYGPATTKAGFCGGGWPRPTAVCAAVVETPFGLITVNVPALSPLIVNVPLSGFTAVSPGLAIPVMEMGIPRNNGIPEIIVYVYVVLEPLWVADVMLTAGGVYPLTGAFSVTT